MTAPGEPDLAAVIGALAQLPAQLTGRDGQDIRERVERLAGILGAKGSDAELRSRAAAELEQLVATVTRMAGGKGKHAIDLGQLAGGLRSFVEYLRAPTVANQAQVEQMMATLHGTALPRPVPLDQLNIDATVEELAVESARRHGLAGAEARHAVARMKREMTQLVRQLEQRAQQEAGRATAAADMERLFDRVVDTGTPLGQALAAERTALVTAFRSVDLAHMAEGLRVFGAWLVRPSRDPAAHVAELRTRLTEALGPPTAGDPARSEDERRHDFEREIQNAVDQIFRGSGLAGGAGGGGPGGSGAAGGPGAR